MASLRRSKTLSADGQTARFLYTILKQLDLKTIDWNAVAAAMEITNGHAARMRFSRFKQHMEGVPTQPRTPRTKTEKKEKKEKEGLEKPVKKGIKRDADGDVKEETPGEFGLLGEGRIKVEKEMDAIGEGPGMSGMRELQMAERIRGSSIVPEESNYTLATGDTHGLVAPVDLQLPRSELGNSPVSGMLSIGPAQTPAVMVKKEQEESAGNDDQDTRDIIVVKNEMIEF